jgi:hypothetical protein
MAQEKHSKERAAAAEGLIDRSRPLQGSIEPVALAERDQILG